MNDYRLTEDTDRNHVDSNLARLAPEISVAEFIFYFSSIMVNCLLSRKQKFFSYFGIYTEMHYDSFVRFSIPYQSVIYQTILVMNNRPGKFYLKNQSVLKNAL